MPGVMQRKGKLPGRTLRVSFKSAFFSVKTPPPHLLIFPSIWLSPLQKRSDERMGDLKPRLPKRRCKTEAAAVCANYGLAQKYPCVGIKGGSCVQWASESMLSASPLIFSVRQMEVSDFDR